MPDQEENAIAYRARLREQADAEQPSSFTPIQQADSPQPGQPLLQQPYTEITEDTGGETGVEANGETGVEANGEAGVEANGEAGVIHTPVLSADVPGGDPEDVTEEDQLGFESAAADYDYNEDLDAETDDDDTFDAGIDAAE